MVTKRPSPASSKGCRTSTGVALQLEGSGFPADLAVKAPPTEQAKRYLRTQSGQTWHFTYNLTVSNNGPSATLSGAFTFHVQPGFEEMASIAHADWNTPVLPIQGKPSPPFGACTNSTPYLITCPYAAWFQPGTTLTITIDWFLRSPTDEGNSYVDEMLLDWGVASSDPNLDPNAADNTRTQAVFFCWPAATDPGCASAPSS